MSRDVHVNFKKANLPTVAQWNSAINKCGFELRLMAGVDLSSHEGWIPCKWGEVDSGFEYFLQESDGKFNHRVILSAASDAVECAHAAAAGLAVLTKGEIEDPQEGSTIRSTDAIAWARGEKIAPKAPKVKASKSLPPELMRINSHLKSEEAGFQIKDFITAGDLVIPTITRSAGTILIDWLSLESDLEGVGFYPVILAEEDPEPLLQRLVSHSPNWSTVMRAARAVDTGVALEEAESGASRALRDFAAADLPHLRPPFCTELCRLEALQKVKKLRLKLILLPTSDPTAIPAFFGRFGSAGSSGPGVHVAMLKRWGGKNGLKFCAIWNDGYSVYFEEPKSHETAVERASEYAAFSPATLERSVNNAAHYVQMTRLWGKRAFWWPA